MFPILKIIKENEFFEDLSYNGFLSCVCFAEIIAYYLINSVLWSLSCILIMSLSSVSVNNLFCVKF